MLKKSRYLLAIPILISSLSTNAEITLDGTLGRIGSATFSSGKSGDVSIKVTDTLTISGKSEVGLMSGIFASTQPLLSVDPNYNTGDAGNIELKAGKINLLDGGIISSNSLGLGNAGVIKVKTNKLTASGKTFSDYWNRYYHSGISSSSRVADEVGGQAGAIIVQADIIHLIDEGEIATSAANAGGGNIEIKTADLLYLQGGRITTSVQSGISDGGNINISNPQFTVLNQGNIIAQAYEGHGGDIYIKSEQFVTSQNSLVSASSRLGIDGEVNIDSPEMDMEGFLVVLPGGFIEASHPMETLCDQTKKMNHFFIKQSEGVPNSPEDLLPSGPFLSDKAKRAVVLKGNSTTD